LWHNRPAKLLNLVKNAKYGLLRRSRSFKIIEVGTNRKFVCDFLLLVMNSNWHPISYHFRVIAAYCSNFGHFAFLSAPLGDLRTTYDIYLRFIEKRAVDFLLVLTELISLGVVNLRLRRYERISIENWRFRSIQWDQFDPKFQGEGVASTNHSSCH